MKTSELTGIALDWAVHYAMHGECEGYAEHEYSTNWAQGGPIIDREKIGLREPHETPDVWYARITTDVTVFMKSGPTPLIAAMRCFVSSKLGDGIEIPPELTP